MRFSLRRFPSAAHHKSRQCSPAPAKRNFMLEPVAGIVALCRQPGPPRNDVTPSSSRFRAIMPASRGRSMQGRHYAMRPILAIVLLCSAFAGLEAQAEPTAETIARGKALTEAADCAG